MPNRLEEFEKKLYKRGDEETKKKKGYELYKEEAPLVKEGWDEEGARTATSLVRRRDLRVLVFLLFAASAVAWGYYWFSGEAPFATKDVAGAITGPDRVTAGEEISFTVSYRNNSEAALRDAYVLFTWPEGSTPLDEKGLSFSTDGPVRAEIGTILPRQEKSATFRGRAYGPKDSVKELQSVFRYAPEGFNSNFEDRKTFQFTIASSPFALGLTMPGQVVADKEVEITLEYQNQSEAPFDNIVVRTEHSEGFRLVSMTPALDVRENTWRIGTVLGKGEGTIRVVGMFAGAQGETKSLYMEIGTMNGDDFIGYATASGTISIASSALFVFQTVNDSRDYSANPGTNLQYKIRYKNTTNVQIPNAVIIAKINEAHVDIRSLNVQWGSFDGRTNSIIWNAVGVPDLAILDPKEEGVVSFSVNLKPVFLPKTFADKNLTVVSHAQITSSVPPESLKGLPIDSEDTLEVKVNTQFSFNETAYYQGGLIPNTGPLPPRVGQRTTYAVSWQLSNTVNDVDGIEVRAVVPPNVEWTGVVSPPDAQLTYDPSSGVVTWTPDKVSAGTGILGPATRVDFQVAFTPALVHAGQTADLLSGSSLKAADAFTGLKIERQSPPVDTSLLSSLKGDQGRIAQ